MSFLSQLKSIFDRFAAHLSEEAKDLESDVMEVIREGIDEFKEDLESFGDGLKRFGVENIDDIFAILRRVQPILVTEKIAIVTRYEDVKEVLSQDDAFDVTYGDRMKEISNGENFFLGMRDGHRYTRDHSNMMVTIRREDVTVKVVPFVAQTARELVESNRQGMDAVAKLTQIVPARLVGEYFGTPGPDEATLFRWTAALFHWLFLDQAGDPPVRAAALAASQELNAYLDETIAKRKEKPTSKDDVLARCLALQQAGFPGNSDLDIRNNLMGQLIGAVPTTGTCAALALDELLNRPRELAGAQGAALANDDSLLRAYVLEALRFNPMNPGIFRTARRDFVVARDERRAKLIPKGLTVIAATRSAMFDSLDITEPTEFRTNRPQREYMLWGYGMHTCFGQHINNAQIPQILKPLLQKPNLRRAAGSAGQLKLAGPFASNLELLFD